VCFPWSEFDGDEPDTVVEIDPGRAFGTGAHPSTRLLLVELACSLRGGERVLDVGCGSGVLAVCAARLGARVTAVDITDEALTATRRNAIRNGVETDVHVSATPVERLSGRFDAIVANIGATVLIELASALQSRLDPDGWLALSGLSPGQVSKVAAAYSRLEITAVRADDDWVALVGRHRAGPSGAGSPPGSTDVTS
jgi:ribosomal protein L11 methyltransferase